MPRAPPLRLPIMHPALLVWFFRSLSGFLYLVHRCCVYCCVFILQVWLRGHLSLSLQVESHSLPQALRTCTEWRKSSGAPATPSPSLSPATRTTASRTQYSRDQLGQVLSTMSRSLFMAPSCCDSAVSEKALLGRVECMLISPTSAHCCCSECLMTYPEF